MFGRRAGGAPQADAAPERRRSVRHTVLSEVARLIVGEREALCRLVDVSPGGLRIQVYVSLVAGDCVAIELRTGHRLLGRIAWVAEGLAGVAFAGAVPIGEMLTHCSFDERLMRTRAPRVTASGAAALLLEEGEPALPAKIANLSLSGAQLLCAGAFASDLPCTLVAPGLPPRPARVRWSHDGHVGLEYDVPMGFAEFAEWQETGAAATPDLAER